MQQLADQSAVGGRDQIFKRKPYDGVRRSTQYGDGGAGREGDPTIRIEFEKNFRCGKGECHKAIAFDFELAIERRVIPWFLHGQCHRSGKSLHSQNEPLDYRNRVNELRIFGMPRWTVTAQPGSPQPHQIEPLAAVEARVKAASGGQGVTLIHRPAAAAVAAQ